MKISRSQLLMQQTHTHTLTTPQTVKLLFMLTTNVSDRNISPYEKIELFLNFLGSTRGRKHECREYATLIYQSHQSVNENGSTEMVYSV